MYKNELCFLIEQGKAMCQNDTTSKSPEFIAWKNKTIRLLDKLYGKDSREVSVLEKRTFYPSFTVLDSEMDKRSNEKFRVDMETTMLELSEYYNECDSDESVSTNETYDSMSTKVFI